MVGIISDEYLKKKGVVEMFFAHDRWGVIQEWGLESEKFPVGELSGYTSQTEAEGAARDLWRQGLRRLYIWPPQSEGLRYYPVPL